MIFPGSPDNDDLKGTGQADEFDLDAGGDDKARGLGGDDVFFMGGELTGADRLFGGAGYDTVELQGQHAGQLALTSATLDSIEQIKLFGALDYNVFLDDTAVAAGQTMTIDITTGSAGHTAIVSVFESDGRYIVKGGAEQDIISTGAGDDVVYGGDGIDHLSPGFGNDKVYGGAGNDVINFNGGWLDSHDRVNGGDGSDTLQIGGDVTATKAMFSNIESAEVQSASLAHVDFTQFNTNGLTNFSFNAGGSSAGVIFTMAGQNLPISMLGSRYDDVLTGGRGDNTFWGGNGSDTMTGGGHVDTYIFQVTDTTNDSTGPAFDTINGFDAAEDFLGLLVGPSVVTPGMGDPNVTHGRLAAAHFNHDLTAAMGADELPAGDAVLFKPSSGTYDGEWFLVVDINGTAGYQANDDIVIHLHNVHNLDQLDEDNFITSL